MIGFYRSLVNTIPRFNIVYGYVPKRSPFDKTHYIENYIPRQIPYPKSRRPRLPQWDDEQTIWPVIPPSPIQSRQKLLQQLEKEEYERLQIIKPMTFPDFRVGDVIQVKWIHNMSEPTMNTYQGLCVGKRRSNSLDASFKFIFRYCGVDVFMNVKQNSPYLKEVTILKKGTGNIRNKVALFTKRLAKQQFITPIMKKGKPVRRKDDPIRKRSSRSRTSISMLKSIEDPLLVEKPVEKKIKKVYKKKQAEQETIIEPNENTNKQQ
ncbi:unnamed protein product [Paramecium primaurelia]|uniref:Ribosomal protein L19 n=2 Tax=Paramecium TaxID=5884 RepID=A0A8S1UAN9_9CILI|nr:unnamed protein product [Paramecium primaurelia]CAD8161364.1 unnamed protein product [Paramecium pentaurelia]